MTLEIRPKLVGCDDKYKWELLEQSVACLSIKQRLSNVIDRELFAIFVLDKHNAYYCFRDYQIDEQLLSIHGLGNEWRKS